MIDRFVVGGFYRVHTARGKDENLNAPGRAVRAARVRGAVHSRPAAARRAARPIASTRTASSRGSRSSRRRSRSRSSRREEPSADGAGRRARVITPEYCQLLARYNRWMNERMYARVAAMPDDERKRDRGAFFGSIHRTLNHLLWGDSIWLGASPASRTRSARTAPTCSTTSTTLARERETRRPRDPRLGGAARRPSWLASTLEYRSAGDGRLRRLAGVDRRDAPVQPCDASSRTAHDADEAGGRRSGRDRPAVPAGRDADSRLTKSRPAPPAPMIRYLALLGLHFLINFGLLPDNVVVSHPVHHDDYSNLGASIERRSGC